MVNSKLDFSENELTLMVDALNGVGCQPLTFVGNIQGALEWQDLGGKHNVDVEQLLIKLEDLPLIKIAELHAAIEEFWSGGTIPNIRARLIEVGLLPA